MKKLYGIYAIAGIIFLGVLTISPFKDYFREWRSVQTEYNKYIQKLPQKVEPVPVALQQIWSRELDRIDRCVSCHVGINNSKLVNAPQPFRSHTQIPHETEKFGCTICHEGQGLATDYADSHLLSKFWEKPVLPNRYLESSCGQCHINEDLELTPTLNKGRELISDYNCIACHDLPQGYSKSFVPSLDGIGSKVVSRSWLIRWLHNPQEIQPETKMPDFMLSVEEAEILADFLLSFKSFANDTRLDSLPEVYRQQKDEDEFIQLGKTRFREARCISCHAVEGKGGHLAVDLVKIGSKASDVWIFNFIKNPNHLQPGIEMPQYGFSTEEVAAITAYMESEFLDWDAPEDTAAVHQTPANFFEQGLALYNQYNCGGCHTLSSEKISLNPGPELTSMGSKKIYEIDFGSSDIPLTLYDYIETKINAPRIFGESTKMPEYNFKKSDYQAIATVLLSYKNEPLPGDFIRTVSQSPTYDPQGKVGRIIKKYSCLKCHLINQTGGTIAPELSIVGSQLQQPWMENYFKLPYSLRPVMEERMPNLFISDGEIKTLIDYFYTVLVDDSIFIEDEWDNSTAAIERGQGLYREKYGCQSCHMLGGTGGYVGPPLDDTGNRLQPGWVYRWLLNPQKYKPGTLDPKSGMSEVEAMDLTAYLMSQKAEK